VARSQESAFCCVRPARPLSAGRPAPHHVRLRLRRRRYWKTDFSPAEGQRTSICVLVGWPPQRRQCYSSGSYNHRRPQRQRAKRESTCLLLNFGVARLSSAGQSVIRSAGCGGGCAPAARVIAAVRCDDYVGPSGSKLMLFCCRCCCCCLCHRCCCCCCCCCCFSASTFGGQPVGRPDGRPADCQLHEPAVVLDETKQDKHAATSANLQLDKTNKLLLARSLQPLRLASVGPN
jgi:hypothetical protein